MMPRPQLQDVQQAASMLLGHVHRTPMLTSRTLDQLAGNKVACKSEHLQRSGAFKFRGAYHALLRLGEVSRSPRVLTQSSGNHAQALALAGRLLGFEVHVVMPRESPQVKREATASHGAHLYWCDAHPADRLRVLDQVKEKTAATYVAPYDDPHIIAGAGTVALEMLEQDPDLDVLVIPVGGGGLLGGMAMAAKSLKPTIKVYGAEPSGADDAHRSLLAGKPLPMPEPDTIADGLLTSLGEWTWPLIQHYVDHIFTVPDHAIVEAMRLLWGRMKQVVEPSGAVALAVALSHAFKARHAGERIGLVLSGGNVDLGFLAHDKQS